MDESTKLFKALPPVPHWAGAAFILLTASRHPRGALRAPSASSVHAGNGRAIDTNFILLRLSLTSIRFDAYQYTVEA